MFNLKNLSAIWLFLGAVRWPQTTALDHGPGRVIDVTIDLLCIAYLLYKFNKED